MRRFNIFFLGSASVVASALGLTLQRDASACGGCFQPPPPPGQTASDITDERMLLAVSPQQSTLYDQIKYTGSPSSFAWVLPIRGTVDVGLSADVLFDSIDELTVTQITQPPSNCPSPSGCNQGGGCGGDDSSSSPPASYAGSNSNNAPTVMVTKQETVGPYDTVQLRTTDPGALNNWLSANGFAIPAAETPVLDAYVAEGFDFLAMKLLPNEGIQAMRPVRVTSPGASLSLPLRMASVGTGAIVGITIWVVADGRYEPQNFPFFRIDNSALVWDWKTSSSNYTLLRSQQESALSNAGWEIESSINLNEQTITNVVLGGGQYRGPYGGFSQGMPADPALDYLPVVDPDGGTDGAGGGVVETADAVRADDLKAFFAGMTGSSVRVTRIRSDIAHAAMKADLVLQASSDQSEISNVRTAAKSVNETCPLYDGCNVKGYGTYAQAEASVSGGCNTSWPLSRGPLTAGGAVAASIAVAAARWARMRRRAPLGAARARRSR
jgi:hypothetical protein